MIGKTGDNLAYTTPSENLFFYKGSALTGPFFVIHKREVAVPDVEEAGGNGVYVLTLGDVPLYRVAVRLDNRGTGGQQLPAEAFAA